jgi:CAI-1 autoinducer synthase
MQEHAKKLGGWREETYPGEIPSLTARLARYHERIKDGHPVKGKAPNPGAVELWSNDYLSLNDNPAVVEAQVKALEGGRNDLFMSAALLNDTSDQRTLERQMAGYIGTENAVLCQSGWCANVGLIQAIADLTTPVYIDIHAHASLWEGISAAGAKARPFRHNNSESLESQVKRHGPGVIVVDSIYSADGSICPLDEVAAIGERHGCTVVVDESHSVGLFGRNGQGLVPLLGLSNKVHFRTFSLSKAFVTRAGVVAGPAEIMDYFPYESRPAIFSSAVLPHEVAGLSAALTVIQEEDWRRQQMWRNARYLRAALSDLGYNVDETESQVIALEAGPEKETMRLRKALENRGVFGAVFCAPATPKDRSLIRLSVNCRMSQEKIELVIAACRDIRDEVGMANWPSTLRKKSRTSQSNLIKTGRPVGGIALAGLGIRSLLAAVNNEFRGAS